MGCRCSRLERKPNKRSKKLKKEKDVDTASIDTIIDVPETIVEKKDDNSGLNPDSDSNSDSTTTVVAVPPAYCVTEFPLVGKNKKDIPEYPITRSEIYDNTIIQASDIRRSDNWSDKLNTNYRFSRPINLGVGQFMGGSVTTQGYPTYENQPVPASNPNLRFERNLRKSVHL